MKLMFGGRILGVQSSERQTRESENCLEGTIQEKYGVLRKRWEFQKAAGLRKH